MRGVGLGLMVLACAAAGCLRSDRPTVPSIVRALTPPMQLEGVILDSVLIEQPLGDQFVDRELWASALPAGLPETRALLAENGLRVGILTGTVPQKFQTLLNSEGDTVNPQRMTFNLRKDAVLPTAGPIDTAKFAVQTDLAGKPKPFELKQVRCGVFVRPEGTSDGPVKVWCEPQIQHGTRQEWFRPNEDVTGFAKHEEVPLEKFTPLAFEATLGPDDYLLIGWSADEPTTLGSVMFAAEVDGRARQRVLVIRARQATPPPSDLPPITNPLKRPAIAAIAGTKK